MPGVIEIEEKDFEREVLQSEIPVLAYFQSDWCPTCKSVNPVVEMYRASYEGRVKFTKIDTLKSPKISADHTVFSTPTLIIFRNGQEVNRNIGFLSENNFKSFLDNNL